MTYNLWDTETSNYFGQFTDEVDALRLVRVLVGRYGAEYADSLGLGGVNDDGIRMEPLSGQALLTRAESVMAAQEQAAVREGEVIATRSRSTFGSDAGYSEPSAALAAKGMSCGPSRAHRIAPSPRTKRQPMH